MNEGRQASAERASPAVPFPGNERLELEPEGKHAVNPRLLKPGGSAPANSGHTNKSKPGRPTPDEMTQLRLLARRVIVQYTQGFTSLRGVPAAWWAQYSWRRQVSPFEKNEQLKMWARAGTDRKTQGFNSQGGSARQ